MGRKVAKVEDFFQLDRYQLLILLFNELLIFTLLSNVIFNIFGALPPKVIGCDGMIYNGTKAERCQLYDGDLSCEHPMLFVEFRSTTVEFSQLCSRHELTWLDNAIRSLGIADKTKFSTTIQMIGVIVGSAIAGQLSDMYGRKRVVVVSLVLLLTASTASSFSSSIDVYVIIRFFVGVFVGALNTVGTIFVVECLPTEHRFWMSTVITWAPNYIFFAFAAYLTGEWRLLGRICNLVTLCALAVVVPFLEESPKFLVQRKHRRRAILALTNINKWKREEDKVSESDIVSLVNRETEHDEGIALIGGKQKKAVKYSFLHLYSTKSLAIKTLVTSFGFFSVSFVTYALIFNLHVLQGSIFLNTAVSGLLRYMVGATVALIDHFGGRKIGRKVMHVLTVGCILLCVSSIYAIYAIGITSEMKTFVQSATLFAFGITGCVFLQMLLTVAEQFPTGIRNLGAAHANVCGRIGNVFGPLLFSIESGLVGFPYLLLSTICLLDIALYQIFLAETKGSPLPSEMPARKKKEKNFDFLKAKA